MKVKKAPSFYVRTGDYVEVLSGDDKGKRGKIVAVNRKKGLVLVEGVNVVKKHIKRGANPKIPQGGRVEMEKPIYACKVALIDPVTNKPTRVGYRYLPDGSKEMFAKKSGTRLRLISPARASREQLGERIAKDIATKKAAKEAALAAFNVPSIEQQIMEVYAKPFPKLL